MFQGETAITIDDKGRLSVPTAYREAIARACQNRLVLTYNPFEPGCLWLFPEKEWESVRDQVIALPTAKIAVMGPEAAINAVYYNKIQEIADPGQRVEYVSKLREEFEILLVGRWHGTPRDWVGPSLRRTGM